MGLLVYDKIALAITLEVALVTGGLVRVMCVYHVKLKMAQVITHDVALWTGDSGWGFMSFLATISIFTGSSLEMETNLNYFLNGGRVDGRVGGRVDGRVWLGGGSVVDDCSNISEIFTAFNFAIFFQHMHLETLIPFTFEFTDLTLKLKLCWGGGIFIGRGNIGGFCYVIIDEGFHFFCS